MRLESLWWRRGLGALGCAVIAVVLLSWLGSDPSWIGVLAAVAAVAAAVWFGSDLADDIASGEWSLPVPTHSERPSLDGRLATLRRLAELAAEPPPDRSATRPAAVELQAILRRATELRVGRTGMSQLPPDLADYLDADPAPRLSPDRLDRLLTRIEEL